MFQPHDYQLAAIDKLRSVMSLGRKRVILVMPTGAGKTVTATEIVRRSVAVNKRALWLAHRVELIDQASDTLMSAGLTVGAMCATATTPPNPYAPVQVATAQTLLARNQRPAADIIVADEAHHFADAAETFAALLRDYSDALVIGPTATPERGDSCGLRNPWDGLVVGATVREMQELWLTDPTRGLVPCEIIRPDRPLEPGQIAQNPVDAYVEHASGRRAIMFARSVALANEYAGEFVMRGIAAKAISAETPWGERRLYVDAFRSGRLQVLTSVGVLTEGFDAPECSCAIVARGCGSAGMWIQMIGRSLRPAPGKRDAVILDLRGVSHEHGRPEDEREYSLDGRGIRLRDPNSYCPVCGAPKEPGEPCSCGYQPSGEETSKPDRVTGDSLKPWMRLRETDDEAMKATRLGRWMGEARKRSFRDGWFKAKFNAVYGHWPTAAMIEQVRETLREKETAA